MYSSTEPALAAGFGVVSLGFDVDGRRIRKKVYGRTRTDVKDKLEQLREEVDHGIKTSASYPVEKAVTDWLEQGLDGRSAKRVSANREALAPLLPLIGKVPSAAARSPESDVGMTGVTRGAGS